MRILTMMAPLLCASVAHAELRVAVMEFSNASPTHEMDALGRGLQSMFTTDLSQVQSLQLVERERLQDIEKELKLARSSLIDKSTAAKIGKLAGATHLFAGSFTVLGGKMRIDGRLFSAENGEVLLAEKMEGDQDAFFDLEKGLVKKVVAVAGVKLQPKERVAVDRVQTTDFNAFRKFSEGMAAFDDKRYDEAIAALKEATRLDGEFKLAAATLEQYQKVVEKLRRKVSDIEVTESRQDAERIARDRKEFAATDLSKGDESDRDRAYANKLTDLYDIYQVYQHQPDDRGDRFARDRNLDSIAQEYFPLAISEWRWVMSGKPWPKYRQLTALPPVAAATFIRVYDQEAEARSQRHVNWWQSTFPCRTIRALVETVQSDDDYFAGKLLNYDEHQIVALQEELTRMAVKTINGLCLKRSSYEDIEPDPEPIRAQLLQRLGRKLRVVLDLPRSTKVLQEAAALTQDKELLRSITRDVEYNRDLEATLATAKNGDLMHQLLQGWWLEDPDKKDHVLSEARAFTDPQKIGRSFALNDYIVIGKTPVWLVRGGLLTGRRSDDRHADEIRYYAGPGALAEWSRKAAPETLAVVAGQPRAAAHVAFTVELVPGGDWPREQAAGERPEVGFVFGLTNVDSPFEPQHGYALLLGATSARLVEFTAGERELKLTTKEERKLDLAANKSLPVTIDLGKDTLSATVAGKNLSFHITSDHDGFYGLQWRGRGFAAVKALTVR
jgi:TolB-like protein